MIKIKGDGEPIQRGPVTKLVTKLARAVTKPGKGGRPRIHASEADKQRACRARKKARA